MRLEERSIGTKVKREKILTASIPRALGEQFKTFCVANNTTQSVMIRQLIQAFLERHGVGKECK